VVAIDHVPGTARAPVGALDAVANEAATAQVGGHAADERIGLRLGGWLGEVRGRVRHRDNGGEQDGGDAEGFQRLRIALVIGTPPVGLQGVA
jgi:hypothetical protein